MVREQIYRITATGDPVDQESIKAKMEESGLRFLEMDCTTSVAGYCEQAVYPTVPLAEGCLFLLSNAALLDPESNYLKNVSVEMLKAVCTTSIPHKLGLAFWHVFRQQNSAYDSANLAIRLLEDGFLYASRLQDERSRSKQAGLADRITAAGRKDQQLEKMIADLYKQFGAAEQEDENGK